LEEARDEIREAGGDVVAIFHYRAEPTRNFCRKRKVSFDCLGDPDMKGYVAVGLDEFSRREQMSPKLAIGAIRAATKGAVTGAPPYEHVNQRPGTFVVGSDGTIVFAHYNREQSDHPSLERMLEAVKRAAAA
jgi:peroxiredoxin